MSNNEWVQEGTPRDDAEWTEETDDYGVPVEPAEWDDYSAEQAVPVPAPPAPAEPRDEPVLPAEEQVTDHANLTTAPEPRDVAGADEPAPTVELGETPEEVAADDGVTEVRDGRAEETVFADDRPVDAADDDVAREVSEGIEAERTEQYHSDEPVIDDTPRDEDLGADLRDGEPVVDEAPRDEPRVGDRRDEQLVDEDPVVVPVADPVGEVRSDEVIEGAPAADEPVVASVDDEAVFDEGGATQVDPDALEETRVTDATAERDPEEVVFGRSPSTDPEATAVAAAPLAAAGGAGSAGLAAPAGMAGLYRTDGDETQVLDTRRTVEDEAAEEEARAAALRAEKEERDRRLGRVQTSDANAERELRPRAKGVGRFGSFGLFVLRLITAAILGILAYQVLYSIDATAEFLTRQPLIPEPRLVAWILGFTLAAMAVMLVIGLGVRIVGLVLAALGIAALALIRWGSFSPFVDGMEGFLGDKDLLMIGIGILFLSLGGGRFGIDGAIFRSREEAREAKRN